MTWVNTSPLVKKYTLEEFWVLPAPPDGSKVELIAGVLYLTPRPEHFHDNVVSHLNREIVTHLIRTGDDGTLYVPRAAIWTPPNTHLEPDLFYVSAELKARLHPNHRTTADLVVEIVSPSSAIYDRNTKADTYGALGVRELWLIDEKQQSVEVRNQTGNGFGTGAGFKGSERVVSQVFPTLDLPVYKLFRD